MIKKIVSNTIAQVLSKASTAIISIFLIWVLTNYLNVEGYWMYSKIYNYLWIFAFLADLWLYTIWIREISSNKEKADEISWNILTLRTITWVSIVWIAYIIALFLPWYNSDIALKSVLIVWLFTILSLINSSILSSMHAFLKSEKSIISTIVWKSINILIVLWVVFIAFPKGTEYNNETVFLLIMSAWFFWVFVMTLMNYYFSREVLNIKYRFDFQYIKHIFKISLPYWIALFLSNLYMKVDTFLLSILEGKEVSDISVALYNVPIKITEVAMFFWIMLLSSLLPSFTKFYKSWNKEKFTELTKITFKVLSTLWFIFLLFWILFRDNIITIIANSDYVNHEIYKYTSSDALFIVLFVLFFYFISQLFIYILIASEKQWFLLKANIVITVFNIVWNIIFIPKYSFVWAWIITILSQILLCLILYFKIKDKVWKIFDLKFLIISLFTFLLLFYAWKNCVYYFHTWIFSDTIIYGLPIVIIYSGLIYYLCIKKEIKSLFLS